MKILVAEGNPKISTYLPTYLPTCSREVSDAGFVVDQVEYGCVALQQARPEAGDPLPGLDG